MLIVIDLCLEKIKLLYPGWISAERYKLFFKMIRLQPATITWNFRNSRSNPWKSYRDKKRYWKTLKEKLRGNEGVWGNRGKNAKGQSVRETITVGCAMKMVWKRHTRNDKKLACINTQVETRTRTRIQMEKMELRIIQFEGRTFPVPKMYWIF